MSRLDRMASNLDVVQMGATIGREFTYELMRAVSTLDEAVLQAELTKLVESELLFQRGNTPAHSGMVYLQPRCSPDQLALA